LVNVFILFFIRGGLAEEERAERERERKRERGRERERERERLSIQKYDDTTWCP